MPNYFTRHPSEKEIWRPRGGARNATFTPRQTAAPKVRTEVRRAAPVRRRTGRSLPDWNDLEGPRGPAVVSGFKLGAGPGRVPMGWITLIVVMLSTAMALYVGHLTRTQQVLADLQKAQRDQLQLNLKYNRLKGEFDRATGPAVIYSRARALGLEESIVYGPTVRTD